jgi:pimeloyl-ACP methyl ester carboxylesterase
MIHFLDELGVERAHLVGHSHGGRVSIALAADEPDRVGRLLLINSAGIPPRRGWRYRRRVAVAKLGRLVGKIGGAPGRRLQERMRSRVASRDYLEASETMRGTFRAVIAANLTDRLRRIGASTLLVWGDRDDDTPLWMGKCMEELIPDAGLVVLEGAGHYSYADSPGQFGAVARRFLIDQPREVAKQ